MNKVKKIIVPLLALALLLPLGAVNVSAAERKISVCGIGRVYAEADSSEITFSVECKESTGAKALAAVKKCADPIVTSASRYGSVSLESLFTYENGDGSHMAQRCYTVTGVEPQRMKELQSYLLQCGAASVGCPIYLLKDRTAAEQAALSAAVTNGKAKAALLGAKGEPASVKELPSGFSECTPYCTVSSDGKIPVEVKVILSYN